MSDPAVRRHLEGDLIRTAERFRLQPDDGLIVTGIKCLGRPYQCWHRCLMRTVIPFMNLVMRSCVIPMLSRLAPCLRVVKDKADAKSFKETFNDHKHVLSRRNAALDLYILLCTFVLGIAYLVVVNLGTLPLSICGWLAVAVCGFIAFWRLYEICILLVALHSSAKYSTPAKMRAVFNTLWHYIEVGIAFGILYASVHLVAPDPFVELKPLSENPPKAEIAEREASRTQFLSSRSDALYFSYVTVTTLGYGDYSPQSAAGKFLVCLQVMIGFFLLVVVIQRGLSAEAGLRSRDQKQSSGTRRLSKRTGVHRCRR